MIRQDLTFSERWGRRLDRGAHVATQFLVDDVAYALLPLLVLLVVTVTTGETSQNFFLLKEWSFASVVIFGVTIRRSIKLKSEQDDTDSWRFNAAIQLPILFIILSVLVLSFVTLLEKGKFPKESADVLALMQTTLFISSVVIFLAIAIVGILTEDMKLDLPRNIERGWLLDEIGRQLKTCDEDLLFAIFQIERVATGEFKPPEDIEWSLRQQEFLVSSLVAKAAQTEALVGKIATALKSLQREARTS